MVSRGSSSINVAIKAVNEAKAALQDAANDVDKIGDAAKRAGQHGDDFGARMGRVGEIVGGFILAQGIMQAPRFLMEAAQAAADDAASVARLQKAVENTGASFDTYSDQLTRTVELAQKRAFTDDAARSSLSLLVAQTGSATEAQRRFGLAMDLSRGANIDLETASKLLGKVTEENVNVLNRYGISVQKGATEAELFGAVQAKFAGQADTFAQSSAGQMEAAKIQMGELKEAVGGVVLPIIGVLASALTGALIPAIDALSPPVRAAGVVFASIGQHMNVVLPLVGGLSASITVSAIPALIRLIATTWLHVAALTAQAVAFAMANPWMAAAAIAAGVAVAATIALTNAARSAAPEIEGVGGAAASAAMSIDRASSSTSGLSRAFTDLTFSAMAAKIAEATVAAGMDDATKASGPAIDALREKFEQETKVKEVLDGLTESYTHAKAKQDAHTESTKAAAVVSAAYAKEQEFNQKRVNAMVDAAVESYNRLRDSIRQTTKDAYDLTVALWRANPNADVASQVSLAAAAAASGRQNAVMKIQERLNLPPDHVDHIDTTQANILLGQIPKAATGGIVRARPGGTMVMVGEGGRDEAIVPLGNGAGAGGVTFNISMLDSQSAEEAISRILSVLERRGVIAAGVTVT